jgi:hypothetical protein
LGLSASKAGVKLTFFFLSLSLFLGFGLGFPAY